jgi:hypothetical protein
LIRFPRRLNDYANNPRLKPLIERVRPYIERLNALSVRRRYGREVQTGISAAQESWQQIRRPLWLLRFMHIISRNRK